MLCGANVKHAICNRAGWPYAEAREVFWSWWRQMAEGSGNANPAVRSRCTPEACTLLIFYFVLVMPVGKH